MPGLGGTQQRGTVQRASSVARDTQPSIPLSMPPSIYLPIYLSMYPSVNPSICLSIRHEARGEREKAMTNVVIRERRQANCTRPLP